jgi:hypothetical protein
MLGVRGVEEEEVCAWKVWSGGIRVKWVVEPESGRRVWLVKLKRD